MMTDKERNQVPGSQPPEWQAPFAQLDDAMEVSATELGRMERQFLRGVETAQRVQRRTQRQPWRNWRWALAGAFIVALLVCGPLLLHERPAPVAAPYPGMQGQVISACDLMPVGGVSVWVKDAAGGIVPGAAAQAERKLVDITDSSGFFDVPPGEIDQPCQIVLTQAGVDVASLIEQPGARDFTGYQQIMIMGSGAFPEEAFRFDVQPGQTVKPAPGVQVRLDSPARQHWFGALQHEHEWPAAFSYGCVLDGIYRLDGEPADGLELAVLLDPVALEFYQAQPEDVELIAYCEKYSKADDREGFHRGWYRADQPPAGCGLAPVCPTLSRDKEGRASMTWRATPGVRYAIKAPMQITGELAFVYYTERAADPSSRPYLRLQLLNQNKPQLYVCEVWRDQGAGAGWQPITIQPRTHQPFMELCQSSELPEAPKMEDGAWTQPAGRWRLAVEDFTLSERHTFEIDSPPALPEPDQFKLELTPGTVGGMSRARVAGAMERLAQPPAWDYRCDFVDDAYGPEVELPAPYPGSYKIRVTLREKNGAITVLEDSLEVADPGLKLFLPGPFNAVPVLDTVAGEPGVRSEVQVLTGTALANPLPYGYCASHLAGPLIRCVLPPELHGVPLHKVRIVQSASPAGGDTDTITLQPVLWLAPAKQDGPLLQGLNEWHLTETESLDVCNSQLSHIARYALLEAERGGDARALLAGGPFHDHYVAGDANNLKLALGWDIANLPPAGEIVETLRQFTASAAYGRRTVTEMGQRLEWEFDLHGQQVPPGQDLLLGYSIETGGLLLAAQWDMDGTEGSPSYIEIEAAGQAQPWHGNIDYSPLFATLLLEEKHLAH
jgi:hypothetical protein